ncbi:MAG: type II toxin-antitoxin system YafQ family toxin [Lachnospiraceae bacterium]|nr:type II toxin-antitoxin system YafQ family toxin [Lachnospiraceae bacterium]
MEKSGTGSNAYEEQNRIVRTREFHLKPDLLVVYKICEKDVELLMLRFGSHSELF